jgi:hypothetical protein
MALLVLVHAVLVACNGCMEVARHELLNVPWLHLAVYVGFLAWTGKRPESIWERPRVADVASLSRKIASLCRKIASLCRKIASLCRRSLRAPPAGLGNVRIDCVPEPLEYERRVTYCRG